MTTNIIELAERLDRACSSGTAIQQLTVELPDLELSEAYSIQHEIVRRRTGRGEQVVGVKLGFTSIEKMKQMGVSDVIIGSLTSGMHLRTGEAVDLAAGVHPRVEPEVAFRFANGVADVDLSDPTVDLLDHVDAVAPALEVIDSRFRDFAFALADVVADNTSASKFVVGQWSPLEEVRGSLDLSGLSVSLTFDGEEVAQGSTNAILGDPLKALEATRRLADQHGHQITPGGVLLAGSATAAEALRPDVDVVARIEGLGSVSLRTAARPGSRTA